MTGTMMHQSRKDKLEELRNLLGESVRISVNSDSGVSEFNSRLRFGYTDSKTGVFIDFDDPTDSGGRMSREYRTGYFVRNDEGRMQIPVAEVLEVDYLGRTITCGRLLNDGTGRSN